MKRRVRSFLSCAGLVAVSVHAVGLVEGRTVKPPLARPDLSADFDVQFFYSLSLRLPTSYYVRVTSTRARATYEVTTWSRYADVPLGSFPLAEPRTRARNVAKRVPVEVEQALAQASAWSLRDADVLRRDEFIAAEGPFYCMALWDPKHLNRPHSFKVVIRSRRAQGDGRYSQVLHAMERLVLSFDPGMRSYMVGSDGARAAGSAGTGQQVAGWIKAAFTLAAGIVALLSAAWAINRDRKSGGIRRSRFALAGLVGLCGIGLLILAGMFISRVAH